MKKIIKNSCFFLSALCIGIFLLIFAGNICIPEEVIFYDNQTTVKIHNIYYAQKTDDGIITVSTANESQTTADISLLGIIPVTQTDAKSTDRKYVYAGGSLVGIRLYTEGLLVVGTDSILTENGNVSPADDCGILQGDIITHINDEKVTSVADFSRRVISADGSDINLTVKRNGEIKKFSLEPEYSQSEKNTDADCGSGTAQLESAQ